MPDVDFFYHTGVPQRLFDNVRLCGSWDAEGRPSNSWTTVLMQEFIGADGCPTFRATVAFPVTSDGTPLAWGVVVDGPNARAQWGIPTETGDVATVLRVLHLVFNEVYSGDLHLAAEAIRLTRQLAARPTMRTSRACSRSCWSTTHGARHRPAPTAGSG